MRFFIALMGLGILFPLTNQAQEHKACKKYHTCKEYGIYNALHSKYAIMDEYGQKGEIQLTRRMDKKWFVCGEFETINGMRYKSFAVFKGSRLKLCPDRILSVIDDPELKVYDMEHFEDQLVIAGNFDKINNMSSNNIVVWDQKKWKTLDKGMNGNVYAIEVFKDRLIAAGYFSLAGDENVENIAQWDGKRWAPLGDGLSSVKDKNFVINGLMVVGDYLVAYGKISNSGHIPIYNVSYWDGRTWNHVYNPNANTIVNVEDMGNYNIKVHDAENTYMLNLVNQDASIQTINTTAQTVTLPVILK
jgi:hypothetical protein